MATVILDTTAATVSAAALRKVFEAIQVLTESKAERITVDSIVDLIGHDLPNPKWVGRSISSLTHCQPPLLIAERPLGSSKFGRIVNLKLVSDRPLPKTITIVSDPDVKRVHKKKKSADPVEEEKKFIFNTPPPAIPSVVPFASVLLALPSLSRRELLLLTIQAQAQLKETTS